MHAAAIIVAAGRSERFGGEVPKVLAPWRGRPLLASTLDAFDRCDAVDSVVLVASPAVASGWKAAGSPGRKVVAVVGGGATRQGSVAAGLAVVAPGCEIVLVHDGARAFVEPGLISAIVAAAHRSGAALPVLRITDTVKRLADDGTCRFVVTTLDRDELGLAQTPQGFRTGVLRDAHAHASTRSLDLSDDVALVEAAVADGALPGDVRVEAVPGVASNVKVTRPEDLARGVGSRVGIGHDVHPLAPNRPFVLAGVDLWGGEAPAFGPVGHSDGDALCHATCDALLSAAGLGDIGTHHPDTAAENAGRASLEFVASARSAIASEGWRVSNVSAVVQLERPRLAPHVGTIRAALAAALGISPACVGISAKRGEGLGAVGEGRAVACDAVALLERA